MCPPDYFTVDYVINPWMAGNEGAMSLDLAKQQWSSLRDALGAKFPERRFRIKPVIRVLDVGHELPVRGAFDIKH